MPTISVGGSQNVGNSFGSCNAGPLLWNTSRSYKGNVRMRLRKVNVSEAWHKAVMTVWLYNSNGTPFAGPKTLTLFNNGTTPGYTYLALTGGTKSLRLRTQVQVYKNSAGSPVQCEWGSWTGDITWDNSSAT